MKQYMFRKTTTLSISAIIFSFVIDFSFFKSNDAFIVSWIDVLYVFIFLYFLIAWFFHLRADGLDFLNHGIIDRFYNKQELREQTTTEKKLKLPSGLGYIASPTDFDFADSKQKEKTNMYCYILASVILILTITFV